MRNFQCNAASQKKRVSINTASIDYPILTSFCQPPNERVEIKKISIIQRHVKTWLFHRQKEDLKHVSAFLKNKLHEQKDSSQEGSNPGQVRRAAIRIQRKVRAWLLAIHKQPRDIQL